MEKGERPGAVWGWSRFVFGGAGAVVVAPVVFGGVLGAAAVEPLFAADPLDAARLRLADLFSPPAPFCRPGPLLLDPVATNSFACHVLFTASKTSRLLVAFSNTLPSSARN